MLITWRLSFAELKALPFSDFFERSEAAMRDRGREAGAAMRRAAFTAWLQGAGDKKTWGDFCRHYRLDERESAPEKDKTPEELFAWADKVAERVASKK